MELVLRDIIYIAVFLLTILLNYYYSKGVTKERFDAITRMLEDLSKTFLRHEERHTRLESTVQYKDNCLAHRESTENRLDRLEKFVNGP